MTIEQIKEKIKELTNGSETLYQYISDNKPQEYINYLKYQYNLLKIKIYQGILDAYDHLVQVYGPKEKDHIEKEIEKIIEINNIERKLNMLIKEINEKENDNLDRFEDDLFSEIEDKILDRYQK